MVALTLGVSLKNLILNKHTSTFSPPHPPYTYIHVKHFDTIQFTQLHRLKGWVLTVKNEGEEDWLIDWLIDCFNF